LALSEEKLLKADSSAQNTCLCYSSAWARDGRDDYSWEVHRYRNYQNRHAL